ncbi:MAG: hypothetical protein NZQ09_14860, partial [Chloroflexus sp.]|nr:hypothetical protein [Chloroflexus sp.]
MVAQSAIVSLVIVISTIAIVVALHVPAQYRLNFDLPMDLPNRGIGEVEFGGTGPFRWFATQSTLELPALSRAPHRLLMEIHGFGVDSRQLLIRMNDRFAVDFTVPAGWSRVDVLIPAEAIQFSANQLSFNIQPLPPYNEDRLGIAVTRFELRQLAAGALGLEWIGWVLAALLLLLLGGFALRLPVRDKAIIFLTFSASVSYALTMWRLQTLTVWPLTLAALAVVVCGFWLLRWFWFARQQRGSVWFSRVCLIAGFLFVLHVAGMNALQFVDIDHRGRANHVLRIAAGQNDVVQDRLANQYEWGIATVPYSLLSYYPFVPLATLFSTTLQMTIVLKVLVSLLDATTPLLLYLLLVRSGYHPRAGFLAGALFAGLPVTHLYFHDGSYPTILGVWWMVVTWVVINEAVQRARWSWRQMALVSLALVVALLIYVTHTAFVPLVVGVASLLAWRAGDELKQAGQRVLITLAASIAAALVLYYGPYVLPTVTALLARLGEANRLGHDSLPSPLVGTLLEQMWGHTRVLPLLLLPLGLAALARLGWTWLAGVA